MHDRDLVTLIALLRDASGVGLRVSWSGDWGDQDVGCLQHLDPPHQPDGTYAWSLQAGGSLVARRGPTIISVDDTRHGSRRRVDIDRSAPEAKILEDDGWGHRTTPVERAGLHSLAMNDLAFSSGDYSVGLAVRQGVWCV
jgi:hypothetical protein